MALELEELAGIGITVALVDQFTEGAEHLIAKFKELEEQATGSSEHVKEAIENLEMGKGLAAAATGMIGPLIHFGDRAIAESENVSILEKSVDSLSGGVEGLAERVTDVAFKSGIFDDKVMLGAAKNLLGMGMAADRLPEVLEASSMAASNMGRSVEGMGMAFRMIQQMAQQSAAGGRGLSLMMFRRLGLEMQDLQAQGLRIEKGMVKGSVDEIMDASIAAVKARHGEMAAIMAQSTKALATRIEDAVDAGFKAAGDTGLVDAKKEIQRGLLDVIREGSAPFGQAFGEGLGIALKALAPIGMMIKAAAMAVASFVKEHPGIVKIAVALTGLLGALFAVAGAFAIIKGAGMLVIPAMRMAAASVAEFTASLRASLSAAPGILALMALAAALHAAWEENVGGIRDKLSGLWDRFSTVVKGIVALVSSENGGLGEIPHELREKLIREGLWGITVDIATWAVRIKDLFVGAWEGIKQGAAAIGRIFTPVLWIFRELAAAVGAVSKAFASMFGGQGAGVGTKEASDSFKTLGEHLGAVAVGITAVVGASKAIGFVRHGIGSIRDIVATLTGKKSVTEKAKELLEKGEEGQRVFVTNWPSGFGGGGGGGTIEGKVEEAAKDAVLKKVAEKGGWLSAIRGLAGRAGGLLSGAGSAITGAGSGLWGWLTTDLATLASGSSGLGAVGGGAAAGGAVAAAGLAGYGFGTLLDRMLGLSDAISGTGRFARKSDDDEEFDRRMKERAEFLAAVNSPTAGAAPEAASAGGAGSDKGITVNMMVDGQVLHSSVFDREGNVRQRSGVG